MNKFQGRTKKEKGRTCLTQAQLGWATPGPGFPVDQMRLKENKEASSKYSTCTLLNPDPNKPTIKNDL